MKRGIDFIGVSVGAMIFNDKKELLLCKRSQKATNERGCWEVPGGSVEFGEKLENAIKREIKEELAIELEIVKQFPAANHLIPDEHQHWVATTFLCNIIGDNLPKIMEPDKCDKIGWFPMNKLPSPLSLITQLDVEYFNRVSTITSTITSEVKED